MKQARIELVARLWLGLFLLPAPASADVVGPPPERCPFGSIPDTSHAGPTCTPAACTSALDCEIGQVCVEYGLCVESVNGFSHGYSFQMEHALTACGEGGTCPPSATCVTDRRCVPRMATVIGGDSWAMPLAVAGLVVGAVLLLLLALGVGAFAWWKRRRARREAARRG